MNDGIRDIDFVRFVTERWARADDTLWFLKEIRACGWNIDKVTLKDLEEVLENIMERIGVDTSLNPLDYERNYD
jgi:hypothetical protein